MIKFSGLSFFIFLLVLMPASVMAQLSTTLIPFGRNNSYLADTIKLQSQITSLQQIIEKQRVLNEIAKYYSELGQDFIPPAPDKHICENLLPPNLLCAREYPNLYGNYLRRFQPRVSAAPVLPVVQTIPVIEETVAIEEIEEEEKETLKETVFLWTDINCLNQACEAVIRPNEANSSARYTITVGSILPNGYQIDSISAQGVYAASGDGQRLYIEPAPVSF